MQETLKVFDDYITELVNYHHLTVGWEENKLLVFLTSDPFIVTKVKQRARKLGVRFRKRKDYIEFFI